MAQAPKATNKTQGPIPPTPLIDETPLPDLADSLPPVVATPADDLEGLDELAAIDPTSLASEIHEMQLTLSAPDVPRAVRELEIALDIELNPRSATPASPSAQPVYVVELHGQPSEVSLVLSQLREMSRRGELMNQVGIKKPTEAMLATVKREDAAPPHERLDRLAVPHPTSKGSIRVLLVLQAKSTP
jgi:hypothetical protein